MAIILVAMGIGTAVMVRNRDVAYGLVLIWAYLGILIRQTSDLAGQYPMIIAAVVALTKIKPREGSLCFCQLLLYGGISTFIMGALTGGLFGDAPYQLVHMFNPASTWEGLPYLFNPVNNSSLVLYGAMVLGVIHLNTGMAVCFYL